MLQTDIKEALLSSFLSKRQVCHTSFRRRVLFKGLMALIRPIKYGNPEAAISIVSADRQSATDSISERTCPFYSLSLFM